MVAIANATGGNSRSPKLVSTKFHEVSERTTHDRWRNLAFVTIWQTPAVLFALSLPASRAFPGGYALWAQAFIAYILMCLLTALVKKPFTINLVVVLFFSFLTSGLSALLAANDPGGSWQTTTEFIMILCVAPFVIARIISSELISTRLIVGSFVLGQTISAIIAMLQIVGVLTEGLEGGRATGLAGHPNVLGIMCAITIHILLAGMLDKRSNRLLIAGLIIVNSVALALSGSTSAMSAFIIGVIIFCAVLRISIAKSIAWFAAIFGVVVLLNAASLATGLFPSPVSRVEQVTGQTDKLSTIDIRFETMQYAWQSITSSPWFGAGLDDSSGLAYGFGAVTHNILLRSWFQGGIALFFAILAIFVSMGRAVVNSIRYRLSPATAAVIVTVLTYSMTSAMFSQFYYWLPVIYAWLVSCYSTEKFKLTLKSDARK